MILFDPYITLGSRCPGVRVGLGFGVAAQGLRGLRG